MGCSSSRQADEGSEGPQTTSSPTSRALTTQQPHPTSTSALAPNSVSQTVIHHDPSSQSHLSSPRHSSTASHRVSTQRQQPIPSLDAPYALPLSPPTLPITTPQPWTTSHLHRERQDFWETRVTGRSEVWSAIQNACALAREGQIENARGILDAAGVTLPTGSLVQGGYDEIGGLYRVPAWMLGEPENLVPDETTDEATTIAQPGDDGAEKEALLLGEREVGGEDVLADPTHDDERREAKGKAKAVLDEEAVKVKCRLSDRGGPDVVIMLGKAQPVSVLARRVRDEALVPGNARVRIAYLGRVLDEKTALPAQGWKEGHVVNALVIGAQ